MNEIIIAVLGMGILGLFWGLILVIVNKKFHVDENPLIEKIIDCLPGANCGACGFAGCNAFGEAIVDKEVDPVLCPVSESESRQEVAKILGREVKEPEVKLVAKLFCSGARGIVEDKADYMGLKTCAAENVTLGGTKACHYGCLGFADCVAVCPFDALKMEEGLPLVDKEKCTSCGKCIDACPRDLFKLVPIDQELFVPCSSKDNAPIAKKVCKVACIGCKICERVVTNGTFVVKDFLAEVDYEKAKKADKKEIEEVIAKCPQKIIRLED
ncbi:RnfABCDGE type electron transport complex subunit B [Candidatus Margulisiibacteriota bacterium]